MIKTRQLFIVWTALGLMFLLIAFVAASNIPDTLALFLVGFLGWAICFGIAWFLNFRAKRKIG